MLGRRVCVIGAGVSGLTAIKACLEEGLEPVCYERSSQLGGLWTYRDDDLEGVSSVMKSTIINSSKEISAFSDYPPPNDFPNFMHNERMAEYLNMYAKKFDLVPCIRYNSDVIQVYRTKDSKTTGQWEVQIKDKDGTIINETFGAVMVSSGHHVYPHTPEFPGLSTFKGRVIHTHAYKKPVGFDNQRILVVGIGNSGGDAAVELSRVAKQVYLSTRKGTWVLHRVDQNGFPMDIHSLSRFVNFAQGLFPWNLVNSMFEAKLNMKFDHRRFGLKPDHRILAQHPMINDDLPNRVMSGTLQIKHDIDYFTEKGVVFKGDKTEYEIDTVLMATGYNIKFPFLASDIVSVKNNEVSLYKYVFPPDLDPPTLAMIGLIQPLGSVLPISEMQGRWVTRVFKGICNLPSREVMLADIEKKRIDMASKFDQSPRHTIQVLYIPYNDEIAEMIGAKPNYLRLLLSDPQLLYQVLFGPCVPYQYRLNGPNSWSGATDAILTTRKRVVAPLQTRFIRDDRGLLRRVVSLIYGIMIFFFMLMFYHN